MRMQVKICGQLLMAMRELVERGRAIQRLLRRSADPARKVSLRPRDHAGSIDNAIRKLRDRETCGEWIGGLTLAAGEGGVGRGHLQLAFARQLFQQIQLTFSEVALDPSQRHVAPQVDLGERQHCRFFAYLGTGAITAQ